MHFGIILFPGTNCEQDCLHVVRDVMGHTGRIVWHEETSLAEFDALILPGGFAHGDYLRTGAIARFSPIMNAVTEFAAFGKPVIGICNGFQILCEAGLLPGVLRRNAGQHFVCKNQWLRVEDNRNIFLQLLNPGDRLLLPIRHGEGSYYVDPDVLEEMEANGQVLLRYCDGAGDATIGANPNGSVTNIAGVMNRAGNVFGLMPHPEAASEPILSCTDGLYIFRGMTTPFAPTVAATQDATVTGAGNSMFLAPDVTA